MSIAIPGSPLSDDDLRAWLKGQAGTGVHEAIRSIVTELLARREADRAGQSLADLESALVELGAHALRLDVEHAAVYLTRFDDGWHPRVQSDAWGAAEYATRLPAQPSITAALLAAVEAIVSHREGAAMLASRGGR